MKRFGGWSSSLLHAGFRPHPAAHNSSSNIFIGQLELLFNKRFCATTSAAASVASPTAPQPASPSPRVPPSPGTTSQQGGGYKSSHQGQGKPMPKQSPTISSCAEEAGSVDSRPLTALQRRMLKQKEKAVFALTPNAIYRVKTLLQSHQNSSASKGGGDSGSSAPIGIRIGVKKRGCSGYSYTVNYEYGDSPKKPNDARVDQGGVSIFVDGDALFYVIGTNMDFTVTNVEEKFTFSNPNQKHQCGCGESFMPFDA